LGEWVPGLKLSPFFTEQITYESNVFQVPSHAQGSTIIHEIPGFLADYSFGPHSLSVGGRADFLNYIAIPSQNTINYAGLVDLRLEYPRTFVGFRDDVVRTTEPPNTELTGPIVSFTNTLSTRVQYSLTSRFAVGASFGWLHPEYENRQVAEDLNRNEYLVTGSVFWHFVPSATLGVNANYSREIFTLSSDRNVSNYGMTVSVTGDVTAKVSSTLYFGFIDRVPDASFQPGYFGIRMGGGVTYRPTERTTISLQVDRTPVESTFNNTPYYSTLAGILNVSQQITPKITVTATVGGGVNNYPTKQETVSSEFLWRRDTFYAYGITATYAMRSWLFFGVGYNCVGRNSNFDQFNFVDNRFTGRVTIQF